jgi:hypothetical protein
MRFNGDGCIRLKKARLTENCFVRIRIRTLECAAAAGAEVTAPVTSRAWAAQFSARLEQLELIKHPRFANAQNSGAHRHPSQ